MCSLFAESVVSINVFDYKHALRLSFARSSGAGGQNVNKVETKVELRLALDDPLTSSWIPQEVLGRLKEQNQNKIRNGELILVSQRHRTQADNTRDVMEKLQKMVDQACIVPKIRLATEVPDWSKEERRKEKRMRSSVKSLRKQAAWHD